ncbi:MAG: hypothetical protein AAF620_07725 [Bacteroidota bacterium]
MDMYKLINSAFMVLFSVILLAQPGWNWPEDENLKSQAMEKQAYYKLLMAQSKFSEAMKPLNWLYENNPQLNTSIYIDGEKCLKDIVQKTEEKDREKRLQDSILWLYDQRLEYFDNDASTLDRKVYQAFQMYYKEPSKYPMLVDLYEKAYKVNGPEISEFNLSTYMFLAKLYYSRDSNSMTAEKVLDIHTRISDIIETKSKNGGNKERLKKEQDKTDAYLSSIEGILTCEFIASKLVPKFRANPTDLSNAKKIFKYSLQAKCTDQPYFLEASEPVFNEQPSFILANAIGSKYLASGELDKAQEYYLEASQLAVNADDKHTVLMGLASINSKKGNKTKARSLAYEALSAKPGSSEAYNIIGNLYFTSFDDCAGGKSKVLDRAVFIAAYEMYVKARNSAQMKAAKDQFPSIEEIFSENFEEGQNVTIECWINETVALKRRDQ